MDSNGVPAQLADGFATNGNIHLRLSLKNIVNLLHRGLRPMICGALCIALFIISFLRTLSFATHTLFLADCSSLILFLCSIKNPISTPTSTSHRSLICQRMRRRATDRHLLFRYRGSGRPVKEKQVPPPPPSFTLELGRTARFAPS